VDDRRGYDISSSSGFPDKGFPDSEVSDSRGGRLVNSCRGRGRRRGRGRGERLRFEVCRCLELRRRSRRRFFLRRRFAFAFFNSHVARTGMIFLRVVNGKLDDVAYREINRPREISTGTSGADINSGARWGAEDLNFNPEWRI